MLLDSAERRTLVKEAFEASTNKLDSKGVKYTQSMLLEDIDGHLSALPEASVANIGLTTKEKETICQWYIIRLVLAQNATLNHN